jgi:hypothetical protein
MPRSAPVLLLAALVPLAAAQPGPVPGRADWPFDEITLKNGAKFPGLILEETPRGVRFQYVSRRPGKPAYTLTDFFPAAEIQSVKRLPEADRAFLKARLGELDPGGEGERQRMEDLELAPAEWLGSPGAARRYDSDHFALVSSAPEEVTRRAVVKLEHVYTAFARFFPPTAPDTRPTLVLLAPDRAEYRELLGRLGRDDLLNPAVYDPRANLIVCGSDLRRLGTELQAARIHHSQQLAALARYEDGVRKLYRNPELDRHLEAVRQERRKVVLADRANLGKFDAATARLFALLYHEAFHAYVATFAYPPLPPAEVRAGKGTGPLPRWLDEGLAQVFETAVVESGELRADHADPDRLTRAKEQLRRKGGAGGLVPLADLLVSGKETFLAAHADHRAAADRAYLSSWGLAHYLTFDRRVIGTADFRRYLIAVNSGADPRAAFADLVDQDLPAFERDWHSYLLRLRPDGTVGK